MAPNKFNSLFVTATALLLLAAASVTADFNPFCRNSEEKIFCENLVNEATNWHDALTNAIVTMRIIVKQATMMQPELKSAMRAADPNLQKEITEICHEDLSQRVEDLESSLVALKANDIETVVKKLTVGAQDACFFKLQTSKKIGFDTSEGPYYKIVAMVKPGFDICEDIVKLQH